MTKNCSNKPLCAVLLAAYNGEKWIDEQIRSILAQKKINVNIFISIASTGLSQIGNSDATISIINLFDLANREQLKVRLEWLKALECFPHLPKCIDTFRELLVQRIQ